MQVICIYVKQIIRGEAGGNKLKCNWRQKYVIRTIDVRNSDKDESARRDGKTSGAIYPLSTELTVLNLFKVQEKSTSLSLYRFANDYT